MSKENRNPRQRSPQKNHVSKLLTDDTNGAAFTSRYLNDFEPIDCLGKGGYGVVFEAKSKIDGHHYAIKRIALQNSVDSQKRVTCEVDALAKLNHYNIVRYYGAWIERPPVGWQEEHDQQWIDEQKFPPSEFSTGLSQAGWQEERIQQWRNGQISNPSFSESAINLIEDGYSVHQSHSGNIEIKGDQKPMEAFLYIQMELCERLNLGEWLRENKSRDYLCILEIFEQIVNAVKYIHIEGIIHRDLKPQNIFFARDEVKIGDFGLATAITVECEEVLPSNDVSETKNYPTCLRTARVGTHLYMSPEQMAGQDYDEKVDIYSLGIIFYELLVPFWTEMERIAVLTDLRQSLIPFDFSLKYPAECDLLKRMLDNDPQKRPTMWEIKQFLKTLRP